MTCAVLPEKWHYTFIDKASEIPEQTKQHSRLNGSHFRFCLLHGPSKGGARVITSLGAQVDMACWDRDFTEDNYNVHTAGQMESIPCFPSGNPLIFNPSGGSNVQ